jgi:hypothetical protein
MGDKQMAATIQQRFWAFMRPRQRESFAPLLLENKRDRARVAECNNLIEAAKLYHRLVSRQHDYTCYASRLVDAVAFAGVRHLEQFPETF